MIEARIAKLETSSLSSRWVVPLGHLRNVYRPFDTNADITVTQSIDTAMSQT